MITLPLKLALCSLLPERPRGTSAADAVRMVEGASGRDDLLSKSILLVGTGATGRLIGDLRKVGAAQPRQLRVEVREQPALQQRIVGEIDPRNHVADTKSDLLGLGEEAARRADSLISP